MDKVIIKRLRVPALIGVFPEERLTPQDIFIDLEIACDSKPAALSDSVKDTVDYHAVCTRTIEYIENTSFRLVETLAENLADYILKQFQVSWLRLRITKNAFNIPNAEAVGIQIERSQ